MSVTKQSQLEKFLVYPNESIDKLTVNRPFQRMYELIAEKTDGPRKLSVVDASELNYGTATFSSASGYSRTAPATGDAVYDDYYGHMMTIEQLNDFSDRIQEDSTVESFYARTDAESVDGNNCWLKFDNGGFSMTRMPNGNKMLIASFDLGLNDLQVLFRSPSVTAEDVTRQVAVNGRTTFIDLTKDDIFSLRDYADEESIFETDDAYAIGGRTYCRLGGDGVYHKLTKLVDGHEVGLDEGDDLAPYRRYGKIYAKDGLVPVDALGFTDMAAVSSLGGVEVSLPYIMPVVAKMHHNRCDWTSYSSYNQSYIETTFSVTLDIDSLYKKYRDYREFVMVREQPPPDVEVLSEHPDEVTGNEYFNEKPVVMAQVAFYNNESRSLPCFGYCKTDGGKVVDSMFISTNTLSETPLTTEERMGNELTPLNGLVLLKEFKNVYRPNGKIRTNRLTFDVVLKFMAGSATDPRMIDGIQGISAKAKIQVMMIGV